MKKMSTIFTAAALLGALLLGAGPANAAFLAARSQQLDAAGLPFWFQDVTGAAAQPCVIDSRCGIVVPNGTFNGTFPVSFPGNYPEEFFYWSAQSAFFPLGTLGATCDVLMALEVVFVDANGNLVQPTAAGATGSVFQRLNVSISPAQGTSLPATGTVTATGPWGTSTFDIAVECGAPQNNKRCQIKRDIPAAAIPPINFDIPLGSGGFTVPGESVSLFLKQAAATRPAGFFGDGAVQGVTEPPATVTVTSPLGSGSTDQWVITGQTTGMDVAPAGTQDFGLWRVGATSTPKPITITNLTGALTGIPVITPPAGYTIGPANTCTAALNPVAPGNTCTFDISFAPTVNGIASGNVTVSAAPAPPATVAVTGDGEGTIPQVAITGISRITTATSQLLSGSASDFGHPVASVTAVVTPLGGVAGPVQTATLAPGGTWTLNLAGLTANTVNNIAVTATDVALPTGNTNTVNDSIVVDTIPPAVSLTAPANGSLTNIKAPVLTFTATDVNLAATTVQVDGAVVAKVTGNTLDPLADGTHTVSVDASDGAGTHTVVTNSITVDATPPVITVTSPKVVNARVGSKTPALTFAVADANPAPANTVVKLDTVVVPAGTATLGPFLAGSSHTLTVDATDGAGNAAPTTTLAFTIVLADGRIISLGAAPPTIADALITLRHAVGLTTLVGDQFSHADVAPLDVNGIPNPNGTVDIADALVILKAVVGLVVL